VSRTRALTLQQFQALAEFRYQIRTFLSFSDVAAREKGMEPHQHQLLLAVKASPNGPPAVGYLAQRLHIRHNSAVELVDRMEANGLVRRSAASEDKRQVVISLTPLGERVLAALSTEHLAELSQSGPALIAALQEVLV
jgi:DNA-binding MarR family transcriptional regulator